MGGNALKQTKVRRYELDEYKAFTEGVIKDLSGLLPLSRISEVKPYSSKDSFGDLDIVIEDVSSVREVVEQNFASLGVTEVFKNKDVWSLGWGDFQVDLIFKSSDEYDFTLKYLSFNDLGNFIGRTSRRLGFKFGQAGLEYIYRGEKGYVRDVLVTDDFKAALEFLGFDSDRYELGFADLNEIFDYASSSKYFSRDSFDLSKRPHDARTRDAKRKNYTLFLEWLKSSNLPDAGDNVCRVVQLSRALCEFPQFAHRMHAIELEHREDIVFREKFNGRMVGDVTGLKHRELGDFMSKLKNHSVGGKSFKKYVVSSDEKELMLYIKSVFEQVS
ncbi:conserved hypothetical protein [Vibrio chagasii]|nr:conserved hypothetical protein [Vibrio chagasii]